MLTLTDFNTFKSFPARPDDLVVHGNLRTVRLQGNSLKYLDVGAYLPQLQRLYVDKNQLSQVHGLKLASQLEVLSIREQSPISKVTHHDDSQLLYPYMERSDVRKLLLSANTIPTFHLRHDFLNLERLELASCGLKSLPENFAQLIPNLRVANFNFNALKDVKQLGKIKRLGELHLAGNRLSRMRKTITGLSKLASLSVLDLRDNPLTVGFYLPVAENILVVSGNEAGSDDGVQPYVLPPRDKEIDRQYVTRLDETTRLRRKVYEVLLASGCGNLQTLDGHVFDKKSTLAKDELWEQLLSLGIVRKSGTKGMALRDGSRP